MPALGSISMNRNSPRSTTNPARSKNRARDERYGLGPNGTTENTINFSSGWNKIQQVLLTPLLQNITTHRGNNAAIKHLFKAHELTSLYTHVYTMCTQKAPHNWSGKLYFEYRKFLNQHLETKVVPNLVRLVESSSYTSTDPKDSLQLLTVMDQIWKNHRMYVKWSIKLLHYLDRFYVKRLAVDDLKTGKCCFLRCFFDWHHFHEYQQLQLSWNMLVCLVSQSLF